MMRAASGTPALGPLSSRSPRPKGEAGQIPGTEGRGGEGGRSDAPARRVPLARLPSHPRAPAHLAHGVLHGGHGLAWQGALVTEEHRVAAREDADQGLEGCGRYWVLKALTESGDPAGCVPQPTERMGQGRGPAPTSQVLVGEDMAPWGSRSQPW